MEEAKTYGGARPDLKESFVFGLELSKDDPAVVTGNPLLSPNNWPDFMPALRIHLYAFFEAMHGCARSLMRALAVVMERYR